MGISGDLLRKICATLYKTEIGEIWLFWSIFANLNSYLPSLFGISAYLCQSLPFRPTPKGHHTRGHHTRQRHRPLKRHRFIQRHRPGLRYSHPVYAITIKEFVYRYVKKVEGQVVWSRIVTYNTVSHNLSFEFFDISVYRSFLSFDFLDHMDVTVHISSASDCRTMWNGIWHWLLWQWRLRRWKVEVFSSNLVCLHTDISYQWCS